MSSKKSILLTLIVLTVFAFMPLTISHLDMTIKGYGKISKYNSYIEYQTTLDENEVIINGKVKLNFNKSDNSINHTNFVFNHKNQLYYYIYDTLYTYNEGLLKTVGFLGINSDGFFIYDNYLYYNTGRFYERKYATIGGPVTKKDYKKYAFKRIELDSFNIDYIDEKQYVNFYNNVLEKKVYFSENIDLISNLIIELLESKTNEVISFKQLSISDTKVIIYFANTQNYKNYISVYDTVESEYQFINIMVEGEIQNIAGNNSTILIALNNETILEIDLNSKKIKEHYLKI